MSMWQSLPRTGVFLALVTFVALIALRIDSVIAMSVLILWIGSLLIVSAKPSPKPSTNANKTFSLDSIRDLTENSSTPIFVTDKNTVASANRAARKLLGHHIVGQDARVVFRQPEAIALLGKEEAGQAIIRGLVRRHDIWKVSRQTLDGNSAIIEFINQTAESDISRAHTDFVANASHELRTPLSAIIGYVETLQEAREDLDEETTGRFLDTIEREAQRMQALISDLMSLSRVEAGKSELPVEMVKLQPIVDRAARDAAGPDRSDMIELEFAENPLIQGDPQQIEQVVRNLVDNALKYGDEISPVRVKLDLSRAGEARVTVSDKGEGIAPDQIPHLTRRFYRTDPGRSRASGGTGLGLAIVKHIVERHRGRLDIDSQLGIGTNVIIRLPVAKGDPQAN
ncbi:ATP-binding protein [Erythrobacter sp. Alg231-14]|uniref:ATP-binding protein n=1 Tax=Erythrobacter sp. Alg231-14 TaxID=1922225 RepID=UPI000D556213